MKREKFIRLSTLIAGAAAVTGFQSIGKTAEDRREVLSSRTVDVLPISPDERKERIARAQQLMFQNNMAALVIEGGSSLEYFTGISWWLSERTMVAVIPAKGEIIYVCPGFEENRFRELITIGKKVIVWQEDESPYNQITRVFSEAGIPAGKIGMEEQLRFFIFDGIRKAAPQM